MDPCGQLDARIGQIACRTEDVDGLPTDRRQEHFEIRARHELRVHAPGLFEKSPPQIVFATSEALRDPRQMPHGFDRGLGHLGSAGVEQHPAVGEETARAKGVADLGEDHLGLGHRDRGPDVESFGQLIGEHIGDHGAPGVEADDGAGLPPLRVGADQVGR